jgi:hypothetical protein
MKYKLKLGGSGGELYINRINLDQIKILKEKNINEIQISIEEILEILKEDYFDKTEETFIGPYYDNSFTFEVYDEKNEMVWSHYSDDDDSSWNYDQDLSVEIDECSDSYCEFYADDVLVAEVHCRGIFKEYILDLTEEFDPNLLTPKIMEVVQRYAVITDLFYNKEKLYPSEWGDPETSGVDFYLSDKLPY